MHKKFCSIPKQYPLKKIIGGMSVKPIAERPIKNITKTNIKVVNMDSVNKSKKFKDFRISKLFKNKLDILKEKTSLELLKTILPTTKPKTKTKDKIAKDLLFMKRFNNLFFFFILFFIFAIFILILIDILSFVAKRKFT